MRKITTAMALLLASCIVQAQDSPNRLMSMSSSVPTLPADETVRNKFLNQVWTRGTVSFKNGAPSMEVPLIFDEFSEKLYFLQNNLTMEFNNPVSSFAMQMRVKNDTLYVVYRNGFPPIHKNNTETFYEVLADGTYQLLKCRAKTIGLYKEDVPEDQRKENIKEMFYALLPGNKMVALKADKDYLYTQVPGFGETFKTVAESANIKVKNEKTLKELFVALNTQAK